MGRRCLRHQARPIRSDAHLLDLPRRRVRRGPAESPSTPRAVPTSRGSRSRRPSRRPPARPTDPGRRRRRLRHQALGHRHDAHLLDVPRRHRRRLGIGIAVDAQGNAYVTGLRPLAGLPDQCRRVRLEATAASICSSPSSPRRAPHSPTRRTGRSAFDRAPGIAVDGQGSAYVTGQTAHRRTSRQAGAHDTVWDAPVPSMLCHQADASGAGARLLDLPGRDRSDSGSGIAVDAQGTPTSPGDRLAGFPTSPPLTPRASTAATTRS